MRIYEYATNGNLFSKINSISYTRFNLGAKEFMTDIKTIEKVSLQLAKEINANKIYLFGSYANSNINPNSDVDLCIIVKKLAGSKLDLMQRARGFLIDKINEPLDILVYEDKEFFDRASLKNSFEYEILTEGKLLHG